MVVFFLSAVAITTFHRDDNIKLFHRCVREVKKKITNRGRAHQTKLSKLQLLFIFVDWIKMDNKPNQARIVRLLFFSGKCHSARVIPSSDDSFVTREADSAGFTAPLAAGRRNRLILQMNSNYPVSNFIIFAYLYSRARVKSSKTKKTHSHSESSESLRVFTEFRRRATALHKGDTSVNSQHVTRHMFCLAGLYELVNGNFVQEVARTTAGKQGRDLFENCLPIYQHSPTLHNSKKITANSC